MIVKIPLKLDNWNDIIKQCRGNKYMANSHKKAEMMAISYFINKIPKIDKYPVKMAFKWHIKSAISDLDNKSVKSILDCMQNLGILENDNIKYINKIEYEAIKDEKAYYAPMNRSYAIKYAREHGYKYLVQLDDNIVSLKIQYKLGDKFIRGMNNPKGILNDYIKALVLALQSTNAGMSGCNMSGASMPSQNYLRERYCYSIFCLKLDVCPDNFQGGFEDDVEYRLKLMQKGIPSIQIVPLSYGKTGQGNNKDLTGCRKAYADVGVLRGSNMSKLYGNLYKAGMTNKDHSLGNSIKRDYKIFKHKLKTFKLGIIIKDKKKKEELDKHMKYMINKYVESKDEV